MPAKKRQLAMSDDPATNPDAEGHEDIVLEDILPYLINRLTFRMNRLLNRDLRAHGLTISHWRVLAVLDSAESVTVNELAAYAMIEQSTLSRLVMRMEADGLVSRERSEPDGRVVTVSMTARGRAIYAKLRTLSIAHARRVTKGFGEAEQAGLKQSIRRMIDNLDRHPIVVEGSANRD